VNPAFWGRLADVLAKGQEEKIPRLRRARQALAEGDAWDALRQALAPLVRDPGTVRGCLERAGAACCARDIGCSKDRLLTALLHAHEMRSRFTVLDLARLAGILPAQADEIVEAWG
jgi:hypothetical protein